MPWMFVIHIDSFTLLHFIDHDFLPLSPRGRRDIVVAQGGWAGKDKNISTLTLVIFLMMTSSNENIFRVTGHLCGEFTGHRWIPLTKAIDAEFWCFLWSAPE